MTLEDKYRLDEGRALLSGRQALVRLPILQRRLDERRGLNTAGLISGYRGSPLGGYDLELWKAADELSASNISFQPGLNEDLALTTLAGAQQLEFMPGKKVDGVFCVWYGKGPGVDRSGDAIKHANLQGVSAAGGILMVFGDDHTGKSSTTAHQSDLTLASYEVPVLYPSSVAEILEYGLAGFALSRYSGSLVGLKLVNETADATAVVGLQTGIEFILPQQPEPEGGVHIRPEVLAMQRQDVRLARYKLPRAAAFARANRLDRIVFGSDAPRFVVATAGKAYADVMGALHLLGIDAGTARGIGLGVYKIALIFPLDPGGLASATLAAEEVFFVEEKRPQAEIQAKAHLYNDPRRPRVTGKLTPEGTPLLPPDMPLDPVVVAVALAARLTASLPDIREAVPGFAAAMERIHSCLAVPPVSTAVPVRRPAFCPGCPHNSSTKVPQGSFGMTGIGCHGMVLFQRERNPLPMGQMGAEGAHWIGLSRFTSTPHVFQNLGDGTYSHSGSLAIRAAIQAQVNVTFKILLNDAVAMTGGQPVEGSLTVSRVVEQVRAEGVAHVVVVAENPDELVQRDALPPGTELRHRDDLAAVQEALRLQTGVSVIVYDQVCAAEKRRRRKAGTCPDPDRRLFINTAVCEGCGDCSVESNCLAIQPSDTELGRKRSIDQSACNKDFSCVKGFCPSFVTIEGARPRRRPVAAEPLPVDSLPGVTVPTVQDGFDIVIAGIGGTGVVTVSAILGMAARLQGLHASLYDMTGLSQKAGQVFSHIRLRTQPDSVVAARIGPGEADLLLGCDLVAAANGEAVNTLAKGRTRVIGNSDLMATADFQLRPDIDTPRELLEQRLCQAAGVDPLLIPASTLSKSLLGDSIGANILLLGYAWQLGAIPLSQAAIEQAIRMNGRAAEANLRAFAAGRLATRAPAPPAETPMSLEVFIQRRRQDLVAYWNEKYARQYDDLMLRVRRAAGALQGGDEFVWSVARGAYKLMAYKDEYEVARLYTDGRFHQALSQEFEAGGRLKVHLAPPLLAPKDPSSGLPRKMALGPWIFPVFRALAAARSLREGPLDLFGRSAERRLERTLRDEYLAAVTTLSEQLSATNLRSAVELAAAPLRVRGFGHIKTAAAQQLLQRLQAPLATSHPTPAA